MAKRKQVTKGQRANTTTNGEPQEIRMPPIFAKVIKIGGSIPPGEIANLPEDLIENLDHYLYGTPKR